MAAEKYFPFRSVSGDRKYSAEEWAAYFALFLGNGVFYNGADRLKVQAHEGMEIKVGLGAGFINGRMYILEADKALTVETADGVLNRIDRVVLRCDYANRKISTEVKKGSYATSPTAPDLTRDADTYELALADVYVAAGVIEITEANITDLRLNTSLCGVVTGLVEQADTTEIFNQFQAYFEDFKVASQEEFDYWLNNVKEVLSEDAAGNLLAITEQQGSDIATVISALGYTKKNLLKNTAKSTTMNGVTFKVNSDGSVTANGTASATASLVVHAKAQLKKGNYIMSGCPNGGSESETYRATVDIWENDIYVKTCLNSGAEKIFSVGDGATVTYYLMIFAGYTAENLTFYPMIRYADITDDTWEPYVDDVDTRLDLLEGNMLKAETLDDYWIANITADTEEAFLCSIAEKAIQKGIAVNETLCIQTVWHNVAHYCIFCTNLNNTFYMLVAFGSSGQRSTLRYKPDDGTYLYKAAPYQSDVDKLNALIGNVGGLNAKIFNREVEGTYTSTITNVNDIPVGYMGYVYTAMGAPTEGVLFCYGMPNTGYRVQLCTSLYGGGTYIRYLTGTTWREWEKIPTRAEINTINAALPFTIEIDDIAKTINFIDRK